MRYAIDDLACYTRQLSGGTWRLCGDVLGLGLEKEG
jgi:hypothetical protein